MDDPKDRLFNIVKSTSFWIYTFALSLIAVLASLALVGWYLHLSFFSWLVPVFIFYSVLLTLLVLFLLYSFKTAKISESKYKKEIVKLERQAHYDSITELPNRIFFQESLKKYCHVSNQTHLLTAVFLVGLDHFKSFNEVLGHRVGDLLLLAAGKRIKEVMRASDLIARLSGDEFGIIIQAPFKDTSEASRLAARIIKAFHKPLLVEQRVLNITVSVGIAVYPVTSQNPETLLPQAGIALHQAKSYGRNNYQVFTRELNKRYLRTVNIEQQLKSAINNEEFYLVYQPILDLQNNRCVSMEALLRWKNATLGGEISPAEFISIAENSGSIIEIGEWVLEEACHQLSVLQKKFSDSNLQMSVNCSVIQLQKNIFVQYIHKMIKRHEILAKNLILEITESSLMKHVDETLDVLKEINNIGIQIAIDDFGTGYSSLNYLKLLPISILKIDQTFVRDIEKDANNRTIIQTIIHLAKMLKLKVLAEGVETQYQLDFLKENGCEFAQGFYLARPMPSEALKEFLENHKNIQ